MIADIVKIIGEDKTIELADKAINSSMLEFVKFARVFFPGLDLTGYRKLQLRLIEYFGESK